MSEPFTEKEAGRTLTSATLHDILNVLPVPLSWASLPDGTIRFCNRFFTRTFGYTVADLTTVDQWIDRACIREDDRVRVRGNWQNLWRPGGSGLTEVEACELDILCADGRVISAIHRGIILHDLGVGIAIFEDITAHKRSETMARRLAFEDPLTGLANRRALMARWNPAGAQPADMHGHRALLMIDIDGFKQVNDRFGHSAGDDFLVEFAARLRACTGPDDIVYRLGGDEFMIDVACPGGGSARAAAVCEAVLSRLGPPFCLGGEAVELRATVGGSLCPDHGTALRELMEKADAALYRLKKDRKGSWGLFGATG